MIPNESIFENRKHYVMWATVELLKSMNLTMDTNAYQNAQRHAQKCADLFFDRPEQQPGKRDATVDPPAIQPPPGVRTIPPAVPGQRANPAATPVE